jgi:hypothetical protein
MSIEDELVRREAALRGISETMLRMLKAVPDSLMADIVNDFRRGMPQSTSMLPPQPAKPVRKGSGWLPERPLRSPPGAEPGGAIDRMCIADDMRQRQERAHAEREKLVKIHQQLAEMQRTEDLEQKQRDRERDHALDPVNCGLYDK